MRSRPAWARGLKHKVGLNSLIVGHVAPRMGAWIETGMVYEPYTLVVVAPRMGAWIETCINNTSFPHLQVAPRMGAWIETPLFNISKTLFNSRAPHGRVD